MKLFRYNKRQREVERENTTRDILLGYQFAKSGGKIFIPDKLLPEWEKVRIYHQIKGG